ncbi:MAG TPA: tryptophan 2,3-dioxygenase family protein [Kofleriaceae bacterium]|jgi:tryptophan 2,3-dioxygenase|nr:tryptophan 2,3-dioxygenase family protein [Kofleriaceae bacterium]
MGENRRELETSMHLELTKGSTYGDYLRLEDLLAAQHPVTEAHNEMLFIIQHQTSELWIKLLMHELDLAVTLVRSDRLGETFKIFARVAHIQRMLFEQWAVLETMTPSEYLEFRDSLGRASGFQSYQYRALEFVLGNKDAGTLLPHAHDPRIHGELAARLAAPSLYDEFLRWLARQGYPVPADRVDRDFTQPYESSPAVVEVFHTIYADPQHHYAAYDMCEKLVDVEERFQLWRFRHMTTVKRIIGFAQGTGGSSGVGFLKKALDLTFFPEVWEVRTRLASVAPQR